MNSQVLQEGILDVKVPRESEGRKIWKVWRRQWIRFSAVHPHRKDPYLILELSHSSAKTPGNRIRISRDGLHLFRCRSKSRPYRTWTIMSGNKVILFFASDSETCAQEWMQAIRDGLWPPCFSFQMLTAYTQELSLIDDEETFLSGALGAYGRFVLTSEDVLSLVHPHWGATQLQISLFNIQEVILIRKMEKSSAGVLSIVLNGLNDSKPKSLQFYCMTVMEAIQWISSKIFTKILQGNKNFPEIEKETPSPSDAISPETSAHHASGHFNSNIVQPFKESDNSSVGFIDTNVIYENLKCTERNIIHDEDLSSEVIHCEPLIIMNNHDIPENPSEDILIKKESSVEVNTCRSQRPLSKTTISDCYKDSLYENVLDVKICKSNASKLSHKDVDQFYNSETSSLCAKINILERNYHQNANESIEKHTTDVTNIPEYSVVNKRYSTDSSERIAYEGVNALDRIEYLGIEQLNNPVGNVSEISNHLSNFENSKSVSQVILDSTAKKLKKFSEIQLDSFSSTYTYDTVNSGTYSVSNKENAIDDNPENVRNAHSTITNSLANENISENIEINSFRPLPNISDSFLYTRIDPAVKNNKDVRAIKSFEDEFEVLLQSEASNCDDEEFTNHIYEYLSERKGTTYEEIDDGDDDCQSTFDLPPKLPNRPANLQIPSTLRLQKLSQSITEALKVMETTPSPTTSYSPPKFIKKVTDVNRVMNVSPKPELNSANARKDLPVLLSNRQK